MVFEDERAEFRDLYRIFDPLFLLVGYAKQDQRRAIGIAFEMPLHRHDLDRLMLKRVQPVRVPREDLDRRDDRQHPHRHREHAPRGPVGAVADKVQRTDGADHQRGRQECGQHHMDQAVQEGRVEHDGPPVFRHELAMFVDAEASRGLHPAVHAEDPCRRHQRANGHHGGGEHMQTLAHSQATEQHDAQKARLKEKRREHFIGHQRADDGASLVRED